MRCKTFAEKEVDTGEDVKNDENNERECKRDLYVCKIKNKMR